MIFNAPAYDGLAHKATIQGKEVTIYRSVDGQNLSINVVNGRCHTNHQVGIEKCVEQDGEKEVVKEIIDTTNPLRHNTFSYETFTTHNAGTPHSYTATCKALLSLTSVLENFPEIIPSPPKHVPPTAEFLAMVWKDEDPE